MGALSRYTVLDATSRPRRRMDTTPFIEDLDWWTGEPLTVAVPKPFMLTLEPFAPWNSDHATYMGTMLETNPPVWRDDFIAVLQKAGVDNLVLHDVVIESPPNTALLARFFEKTRYPGEPSWADAEHREFHNYKAVNVLGMVSAGDVDLDALVFDEARANGRALFRLAESTNTILVRDDVRDAVLAAGFGDDLTFHAPDDVAL